ncbi:beta-scruin [Brachyhypopomus gauderio]|uniref:beta-scruin n=1 Tax=Brachyhypopomus gauderio TaxID=698409 RepID=UPI004041892B
MPVPEMALSPAKSLHWEVFPGMAVPRVYCAPALVAGRLYVLGGCGEGGLLLDSAEALDLESQSWCQLPPLPTARAGASAVALGDQLVVMGGMDAQQSPLASVEVYHPDEGKWERKAALSQASMGIAALEIALPTPDGHAAFITDLTFIFSAISTAPARPCGSKEARRIATELTVGKASRTAPTPRPESGR